MLNISHGVSYTLSHGIHQIRMTDSSTSATHEFFSVLEEALNDMSSPYLLISFETTDSLPVGHFMENVRMRNRFVFPHNANRIAIMHSFGEWMPAFVSMVNMLRLKAAIQFFRLDENDEALEWLLAA